MKTVILQWVLKCIATLGCLGLIVYTNDCFVLFFEFGELIYTYGECFV